MRARRTLRGSRQGLGALDSSPNGVVSQVFSWFFQVVHGFGMLFQPVFGARGWVLLWSSPHFGAESRETAFGLVFEVFKETEDIESSTRTEIIRSSGQEDHRKTGRSSVLWLRWTSLEPFRCWQKHLFHVF